MSITHSSTMYEESWSLMGSTARHKKMQWISWITLVRYVRLSRILLRSGTEIEPLFFTDDSLIRAPCSLRYAS